MNVFFLFLYPQKCELFTDELVSSFKYFLNKFYCPFVHKKNIIIYI